MGPESKVQRQKFKGGIFLSYKLELFVALNLRNLNEHPIIFSLPSKQAWINMESSNSTVLL